MAEGSQSVYVGIDLGGTNLRGVVITSHGEILAEERFLLGEEKGPEVVAGKTAGLMGDLLEKADVALDAVDRVGVGIAAWLDIIHDRVANAPNLGWRDVPFSRLLRQKIPVPITLYNDLTAVTYGEWSQWAHTEAKNLLCVFVGSGVGSGVVIDRKMYEGSTGYAGELGHIVMVAPHGEPCGCGGTGHLEAYTGGNAIRNRVLRMVRQGELRAVSDLVGGDLDQITAGTLDRAASTGDRAALALLEEISTTLATGIATALNILNPDMLILGGGVLDGAPTYRDLVLQRLQRVALPMVLEGLTITAPRLGGRAGMLGAAFLARDLPREASGG